MSDATLIPGTMRNVSPDDVASLNGCMGLYIGAAGTIVTQDAKGATTTWIVPTGGVTIAGSFSRLMATGNTVPVVNGNFVALFPVR